MSPEIEKHPLPPFIPDKMRILMLGSFPPPQKSWCMDFYYPNFINDMWRIMGLIYFNDKDHFVFAGEKRFKKDDIIAFLTAEGIGIYDTACQIRRLKGNASDAFLEIVQKSPLDKILSANSECTTIVTTGTLATVTMAEIFNCQPPAVGNCTTFSFQGQERHFWRMPSSSRAYPLSLANKAAKYSLVFGNL